MRLEWEAWWMSLGLPNHSSDPDKQYAFFPGKWMRSSHTVRNPDAVITSRFNDQNDKRRQWSVTSSRAPSPRWEATTSSTTYWVVSSANFEGFNKKVKQRVFQKGDLVLAVRWPMIMTHKIKGKFQPKWEWPFVIEIVYLNGAYRLMTSDGDMLMMPINGKFLKKYYLW